MLGTTAYMAPEYLTHGRDSEQLDIYALGVSFYEILSGRKPFEFEGDGRVGRRVRRARDQGAAAAALDAPAGPGRARAHRDEGDRPGSAQAVQDRRQVPPGPRRRRSPTSSNRPIQILHGRPRTDVVQMRRRQRVAPMTPTPHAPGRRSGDGSRRLLGGRSQAADANGAHDSTPESRRPRAVPRRDERAGARSRADHVVVRALRLPGRHVGARRSRSASACGRSRASAATSGSTSGRRTRRSRASTR